jgi:hypothetical protein
MSVDELAKELGVSTSIVNRLTARFRALTGITSGTGFELRLSDSE